MIPCLRTGDLRFRLPETILAYNGSYDASDFGPSCPQQAVRLPILTGLPAEAVDYVVNSIYDVVLPDDEDCEHALHLTRISG